MRKAAYLSVFIFSLFFSGSLRSQWVLLKSDADSLVRLGSDYIYNIEFQKAEECFTEVIKRYPEHPAGYFLRSMVDWWRITLFRYTQKIDEDFLSKTKTVIDKCDSILEENPMDITALFFKGGALGYRGRYYATREKWFDAASDGKAAYDIMLKCYEKARGNHDIMLGTGIYNYFAEALPEKYPWMKAITAFLSGGNKKLGLLQLKASAHHARYSAVEAKVTLVQVNYSFENNMDEALYWASDLFTKYPNNPYFHRYLARIYVKRGEWDNIENYWREVVKRCLERKPGYDNMTAQEGCYYIGIALDRKGDSEGAIKYYKKCDEISEYIDGETASGFRVSALMKIAMLYDRLGRRDDAVRVYKKLLKLRDYDNSHDNAEKYLKIPYRR